MDHLDLKNYVHILVKKWWVIVLCVGISYAVTTAYYTYLDQPTYRASAKLIVINYDGSSDNILPAQINTSLMLINTYKELIRSTAIMSRVVERYPEIPYGAEQLINRISVSTVTNSVVMTITFTDTSYDRAMLVVNSVAEVVKQTIPEIMKVDNVEILDTALPMSNPQRIDANPSLGKMLSIIAGFVVAVAVIFIGDFLDDRIRSEKDVQSLGLPVAASIGKIKYKELVRLKRTARKMFKEEPAYAAVNE
jgi:capsular polysaccharide biosynthesis protein